MQVKFNLNDYKSPRGERSYYKGIPIQFKSLVLQVLKARGLKRYRLRYRGPRIHGTVYNCVLKDAKTFAIYERDYRLF